MVETALTWWPEEIAAWTPPEEVTVSQWADKHRVLSARTTAAPGPWATDLVPYVREIQDAFSNPWVEQITVMGPSQAAKTEITLNCVGYTVDQDPGPVLQVYPTETLAKKFNRERVHPMLEDSPRLARHLTGRQDDLSGLVDTLDRCSLFFSGAASPGNLSSMPIKVLVLDEVDKYPRRAGAEASPIELARERTKTFWNCKILVTCTPTTPEGYINQEYLRGTREQYWIPCPHCGGWQLPEFEHVRWPDDERDPTTMREQSLAAYYCQHCGEQIKTLEFRSTVSRGKWVSAKFQQIDTDTGEITPPMPERVAHRSFNYGALLSPWVSASDMAAKFLDTRGDPADLQNFVNSWQGRTWVDRTESPAVEHVLARRCQLPPLVAPEHAVALTAGIDMQKNGFWFTTWAFTRTMESWLIHYGFLETWDDVGRLVFDTPYTTTDGRAVKIWRAALDSGGGADETEGWSRTEAAYSWVRSNGRGVVHPVKGLSTNIQGTRVRRSVLDKIPDGVGRRRRVTGGLVLWLLDTNKLKDAFFERLLHGEEIGQPVHLHSETEPLYAQHLLAEEKRRNPRTNKYTWQQIGRRRNDLLDATIYAHAAADPQWSGGVRLLAKQQRGPEPMRQPGARPLPATLQARESAW